MSCEEIPDDPGPSRKDIRLADTVGKTELGNQVREDLGNRNGTVRAIPFG